MNVYDGAERGQVDEEIGRGDKGHERNRIHNFERKHTGFGIETLFIMVKHVHG